MSYVHENQRYENTKTNKQIFTIRVFYFTFECSGEEHFAEA